MADMAVDSGKPASDEKLREVLGVDPGLVICGKQAIDDDANQTGQMLAHPGRRLRAPARARGTVGWTRPG